MSVMVADRVAQLEKMHHFAEAVQQASVSEADNKRDYEKKVNQFLDYILSQKRFFRERANALNELLPEIEEFSWFSDLDEETLVSLEGILTLMNNLYVTMRGRYIKANVFFTRNKISAQELREYKAAADDLKELADDMRTRFFVTAKDDEFQAITNELDSL
jgi:hypothetical protein